MPTKQHQGHEYSIDGRRFSWPVLDPETGAPVFAVDDDGIRTGEPLVVTIPMRLKMRVLRAFSAALSQGDEVDAMLGLIEAIAPNQADAIDELDVNEFQTMFAAWQHEYNLLTGASLGESEGSSS